MASTSNLSSDIRKDEKSEETNVPELTVEKATPIRKPNTARKTPETSKNIEWQQIMLTEIRNLHGQVSELTREKLKAEEKSKETKAPPANKRKPAPKKEPEPEEYSDQDESEGILEEDEEEEEDEPPKKVSKNKAKTPPTYAPQIQPPFNPRFFNPNIRITDANMVDNRYY